MINKQSQTSILCVSLLLLFSHLLVGAEEIKDAESATHGSDASMWGIVDRYAFKDYKVIQFELPVLSIYSYLLISDGEALVVDPGRDAAFVLETAKKEGAKIVGVYVTHSHADFVAGHTEVAQATQCKIYQSKKSGVSYPIEALGENSTLSVGKATVRFFETPGHTPDGMCAAVSLKGSEKKPDLIFTGDVLFVGSVGRPDLLGGKVSASWLAKAMYHSWTDKISKLADEVSVFPAHGAGSLCGAHLSDDPVSTIGRERMSNPYLKHKTMGAFVAALLEDLPTAPQYFKHNVQMNQKGPALVKWGEKTGDPLPPQKELTDVERHWVIDLRDATEYAAGHIPNSVNIALRGRLETWVGIMVPWGANAVVVGDEKEIEEGIYRLHRIGYTPKFLTVDSWVKAGLPLTKTPPIKPAALYDQMKKGTAPVIVDVRLKSEWMGLRIGTVLNLPLNELQQLSQQLDPADPVVTVCNSAYRSSMAVGVLERQGFKKAMSLEGGGEAWINASYPVFQQVEAVTPDIPPSFKQYVHLAESVDASTLKRLLMDIPGSFDLVDIRPPQHFSDYHLPGASNVSISELLENKAYLVGPTPLFIVDRDGSFAMMVGGILSQKTQRPIKVLFGGLEAYWSADSGAVRRSLPITPAQSADAAPPAPPAAKKKSAGC